MIEALNMQLDVVRTVIKNDTNEITVCADRKRDTGVFYTVISITSPVIRREIAGIMAQEELFKDNSDYIGSFTLKDSFSLVFTYQSESRLLDMDNVYISEFSDRVEVATAFVAAVAQSGITSSMGMLLLNPRNINLTREKSVYLNYFLDFHEWNDNEDNETLFYSRVASVTFNVLASDFEKKYGDHIPYYPNELQVFYKKIGTKGFGTLNRILAQIKMLPEELEDINGGINRRLRWLRTIIGFVKRNSLMLFLGVVVVITVIYTFYQITTRLNYARLTAENVSYAAMENIGEVYLGELEI